MPLRILQLLLCGVLTTLQGLGLAHANETERVQIWQYQAESPWDGASPDPRIESVRWREGDVEVLFSQVAPCGDWLPVNPVWGVEHFKITLNFTWIPLHGDAPEPRALCLKHVHAWVPDVPAGSYVASFGDAVPVFSQHDGRVVSRPLRAR